MLCEPDIPNKNNLCLVVRKPFVACWLDMSRVGRKPAFCICENKDADQLRGNREADQRLCFHYTDSTIPLFLNPKFQASSHLLWLYRAVCVGPGRKPRRPVFSQRGSFNDVIRCYPLSDSCNSPLSTRHPMVSKTQIPTLAISRPKLLFPGLISWLAKATTVLSFISSYVYLYNPQIFVLYYIFR